MNNRTCIKNIVSMRNCKLGKRPYWSLVYEWEDILRAQLHSELDYVSDYDNIYDSMCRICDKYFHFQLPVFSSPTGWEKSLFFEMTAYKRQNIYNKGSIISWIIDYYISDQEYMAFEKNHCNMEMVLISSRAVYEYMLNKSCPLNIRHLPLSISDIWIPRVGIRYIKEYDVVLTGRPNRRLLEWLICYINQGHSLRILVSSPNIIEALQESLDEKYFKNIDVKIAESREQYMESLRKGKITLYDTKGTDEGKNYTAGWSHVTPRLFEMLANQCFIIARYEDNEDTRWYGLDMLFSSCCSYEQFACEMEKGLNCLIDIDKYRQYLEKHSTSNRSSLLLDYLR